MDVAIDVAIIVLMAFGFLVLAVEQSAMKCELRGLDRLSCENEHSRINDLERIKKLENSVACLQKLLNLRTVLQGPPAEKSDGYHSEM